MSYYNSITIDAHLCSSQCLDKSQVHMNYRVVEANFSWSGQSWGAKSGHGLTGLSGSPGPELCRY